MLKNLKNLMNQQIPLDFNLHFKKLKTINED
ncbi:hypothetical protein HDEF_0888 [Candidatus Hamiltonella defensa 5AT (Acyrthosiphon pisum)]|uniref:Uncharacterized protein n=1 Tax=Hamiltonella defensa subsp. Acyrthosiphon pisum (strain 5AT) TaxID=572265 RepID=C4K4W4_HAMD5|nr:hypothetical protein HDEF_0888 [Candidatus Hamiltonella defensa 5AT (Acyrthosiphon pisum)]